jgi:hypothetical protein
LQGSLLDFFGCLVEFSPALLDLEPNIFNRDADIFNWDADIFNRGGPPTQREPPGATGRVRTLQGGRGQAVNEKLSIEY